MRFDAEKIDPALEAEAKKRLVAKLHAVQAELRRQMHDVGRQKSIHL